MQSPWTGNDNPQTEFPIYQSSERTISKVLDKSKIGIDDTEPKASFSKYPFRLLKVGQSFSCCVSKATRETLNVCAKSYGKRTGKQFTVTYWKEFECYEVARIA